jgi:ABC-type polysaccharide/polyol phosphate transport system ATPase subunit
LISANGKHILKNINLDINEGDRIGIIGKSGAGKTITNKIIIKEKAIFSFLIPESEDICL